MIKRTNYWASFAEGNVYHIYNRGINNCKIFTLEKNYHYFLAKWKNLILPFFETGAYCLMPDHFHFLVWVKPITPELMEEVKVQGTSKSMKFLEKEIEYNQFLEDQFKRLFSAYALAFNKQESRTGSLFQKRFKRVWIKGESKLWRILVYIHHNPIHHSYEKKYGLWKFCSYQAFLSGQPTSIARAGVLAWFGEDMKKALAAFVRYHEDFKIDKAEDFYLDSTFTKP